MKRSQRHVKELEQARSMLIQFQKVYKKCSKLCEQVKKDLSNSSYYQQLQKQALYKLDVCNIDQTIGLKNSLFIALNQILDIEQQLSCEKQKKKTVTEFFKNNKSMSISQGLKKESNARNLMRKSSIIPQTEDSMMKKDISLKFITLDSQEQPATQLEQLSFKKIQKNREQYNLPIYSITNNSTEQKFDSISKCIASLKKNMKIQVQTSQKPALNDYLKLDTSYLKLLQELERYKMREQELPLLIQKQIEKGINKYIKNSEIIEENDSYQIIKIVKKNKENKESKMNLAYLKEIKRKKRQSNLFQNQNLHEKQLHSEKVMSRYQSHRQFNGVIDKVSHQTDNNMRGILDAIGSTVQNNEQKLQQLRSKRQKMFIEEEDIWKEMEKM